MSDPYPTECPVCGYDFFSYVEIPPGGRQVAAIPETRRFCVSLEYSAIIEHD